MIPTIGHFHDWLKAQGYYKWSGPVMFNKPAEEDFPRLREQFLTEWLVRAA